MSIVTKQVEIKVRVANGPASLGQLFAIAHSCGAEVLAACSYWEPSGAVVLLVTNHAPRVMSALGAAGFKCRASEVVLVKAPEKPGLTALLGAKLTATGINVIYSYGFRSECSESYAVFNTEDNDRAIYLLEVDALIHDLAAAKNWRQPPAPAIHEEHVEPQPQAA